ncbi:MAG: tRNA pseudouridine(55) synthase TruB [Gammaproteobacteria bacterium]|nr:tRNA pseudouridine(55) synthase TruB [Gammaproteobacteria bacterium]
MGRSARKPKGFRDVDGILLLDKPKGISSNQALQKVRHMFKANKAGHTGSLDPLATGMLPICFGQATKFSAYLLDACKSYRAVCELGKTTTTGDAEGEITSTAGGDVSLADVESVIKQFTGVIEQIPPMHSAIKVKGQRLYKLARSGREVERAARSVEIHQLDLVEFKPQRLVLDVCCSKGTYIRTLAEDMGKALGCGAYLADLRRTGVHPFWDQHCYSLDELSDKPLDTCLLPVKAALSDFEELIVSAADSENLQQGRAIRVDSMVHSGLMNIVAENGEFVGIGEASEAGLISPKRLMNTAR